MFIKVNARFGGGNQAQEPQKNPVAKVESKSDPQSFKITEKDLISSLSNEKIKEHFEKLKFHHFRQELVTDRKEWIFGVFSSFEKDIESTPTIAERLKEINKLNDFAKLSAFTDLLEITNEPEEKELIQEKRKLFLEEKIPSLNSGEEEQLRDFIKAIIEIISLSPENMEKFAEISFLLDNILSIEEPDKKLLIFEELQKELKNSQKAFASEKEIIAWLDFLQENFSESFKYKLKMKVIIAKMTEFSQIKDPLKKVIFIDQLRIEIKDYAREVGETAELKNIFAHLDKTRNSLMLKFSKQQLNEYNNKKS